MPTRLPPSAPATIRIGVLILAVSIAPLAHAKDGKNAAILGGVAAGVVGGLAAGVLLNGAQAEQLPPPPPPPGTRPVHRDTIRERDVEPVIVERRVVVRDREGDRAFRLNEACEDGDRRACVRLGIIIGEHRERRAEWNRNHPDMFWWDR